MTAISDAYTFAGMAVVLAVGVTFPGWTTYVAAVFVIGGYGVVIASIERIESDAR